MYIYYHGASCFKIKTNQTQLVLNPFSADTGLAKRKFSADLAIISQKENIDPQKVQPYSADFKKPFIINSPGEYEIRSVFIQGLKTDGPVFYSLSVENIQLAYLPGLNRELTEAELELMENTDVLFIPIGGYEVLSGKKADKVISQIEPRLVIPMDYELPGYKIKREPLDKFLQQMGLKNHNQESSLKVDKKRLPDQEMKVVVLKVV